RRAAGGHRRAIERAALSGLALNCRIQSNNALSRKDDFYPDPKTTVEDLIAEGDRFACRRTFRGTHRGEIMGLSATGKPVVGVGMSIHRITNGKIAEGRINFDTLGMLQQLGAIPSSEQARA